MSLKGPINHSDFPQDADIFNKIKLCTFKNSLENNN